MANEVVPTRESIAANMYALRAGLSVVSTEVNKATDAINNAISEKNSDKDRVERRLQKQKDKINSVQNSLNEEHERLSQNESLQYKEYHSNGSNLRWSFMLTLLTLFLLGVAAYMICSICVTRANVFGEEWLQDAVLNKWFGWWTHDVTHFFLEILVLYALTLISLGLAIGAVIFTFIRYGEVANTISKNKEIKKERKKAKHMVKTVIPQNIYALEQELAKEKTTMVVEQEACNNMIAESTAKYKKAIAQILQKHVYPAKAVYQSLLKIFSNQIDERDWANLDYLIYTIETGRAESIKESLQLLDREKQTDRIVAAIQTASREIAQILNRGFSALSEQMTKSFVILSKQIENNTAAILSRIGQLESSQSESSALLSARIAQLTKQQSLNQALVAKANESSEQLVEDVHKIAELENMRYNRGN